MKHIQIQMLGKFSLSWGDTELNDADNRMKKIWLLLAYLIYRRSVVSPEEITALLWEGDDLPENTSGALKTIFYRARTLLNKLGEDAGQTLILRKEGGYIWNPDIPLEFDLDLVDDLYRKAASSQSEEERFAFQRQLLDSGRDKASRCQRYVSFGRETARKNNYIQIRNSP